MPGPSEAHGRAGRPDVTGDVGHVGHDNHVGEVAVPPPPAEPPDDPRARAVPGHVHVAPPVRAHWGVLAAGVVCLAGQAWFQSRPTTSVDSEWWYFALMVVYVLSVALLVAGIVGWLLSRYLRALVTAPAFPLDAAAVPDEPFAHEPAGDEPTSDPLPPTRSSRPGRVPAPTAWRPTGRADVPPEDDHSLWRP